MSFPLKVALSLMHALCNKSKGDLKMFNSKRNKLITTNALCVYT